jgi:hypothetical protein
MSEEPRPPASKGSGSETRQRGETVSFRASKSEKDKFNAIAESHRQSIGDLLRTTLLALPAAPARRQPHPDREALAKLLGLLGNIASNINQYARHRNVRPESDMFDDAMQDAMRELMEYRTLLMQALGFERRRPPQDDESE